MIFPLFFSQKMSEIVLRENQTHFFNIIEKILKTNEHVNILFKPGIGISTIIVKLINKWVEQGKITKDKIVIVTNGIVETHDYTSKDPELKATILHKFVQNSVQENLQYDLIVFCNISPDVLKNRYKHIEISSKYEININSEGISTPPDNLERRFFIQTVNKYINEGIITFQESEHLVQQFQNGCRLLNESFENESPDYEESYFKFKKEKLEIYKTLTDKKV